LLISLSLFSQEKYIKKYYDNGQIKEEGWLKDTQNNSCWKTYYRNGILKKEGSFKDNLETKYWYFYGLNFVLEKEGHFKKGQKNDWCLFYDKLGNINHNCKLRNNKKMGIVYCMKWKSWYRLLNTKMEKNKRMDRLFIL
jgi:antitoxin component YwqK of YwqJK toxin-antitoxin module